MDKRRAPSSRASSHLVRYEDTFLIIWNLTIVPYFKQPLLSVVRGFDALQPQKAPPSDISWPIAAAIAATLLVAFFTRSVDDTSEERTAIARIGVGPALFFFLQATFRTPPDSGWEAALGFLTLVIVGVSGMLARDSITPTLAPGTRRLLVSPAIVLGSTCVDLAIAEPYLANFFVPAGSPWLSAFVRIVAIVILAAGYFFGVIAPRALAGEYASPAQWLLRFALYVASVTIHPFGR